MLGGDPGIGTRRCATECRERLEQPAGVRVRTLLEQRVDVAALDRPTGVHHLHPVDDAGDDTEIVGDEHDRRAQLVLDALHDLEDLRLHRHVERRRRLVGDQHFGLVGDGHRDHHALAHAARELVRVLHRSLFGLRNPHHVEQLDGLAVSSLLLDVLV